MKVPTQVAATALGLVVATGGVLYPINSKIDSLESEITVLKAERTGDELVSAALRDVQDRIDKVNSEIESRDKILCPNTPASRYAVESAVLERVTAAGLRRVSTDRKPSAMGPSTPSFGISLIVEGDAFQLHEFLRGLESLKWLTRVLTLDVQPGSDQRRTSLQIAVLLEEES